MSNRYSLCSLALLVIVLAGCGNHSDADPSTDPLKGDANGYYEVEYQGGLYILGTMESVEKLKSGKPLQTARGGYSGPGVPLYFETDKLGLETRLRSQYERRYRQK